MCNVFFHRAITLSLWAIASGLNLNSHASSPPGDINELIDEEIRQIRSLADPYIQSPVEYQKANSTNAGVRVTRSGVTHGLTCVPECTGNPEDVVEPFYRYRNGTQFNTTGFEVPRSTRFWTGKSAKECVRGKTILLLGDSTMAETTEDLLLLLTGNVSMLDTFAQNVTRVSRGNIVTMTWSSHLGPLSAEFQFGHRNMTIRMPNDNITLKHRFTGHHRLKGNLLGIQSFLSKDLKWEIRRYLSALRPDVIIVNSGQHDNDTNSFKQHFPAVMEEHVMPWLDAGIQVIWKGNNVLGGVGRLSEMDIYVANALAGTGAEFVSVDDVLAGLQDITVADMPSLPHIGMIAKYHNKQFSVFPSQFATFKLLDVICKHV